MHYKSHEEVKRISKFINSENNNHLQITGVIGSFKSFLFASVFENCSNSHLIILNDKEEAGYFLNDLESIFYKGLGKKDLIYFFPRSHKVPYNADDINNDNLLYRAELLNKINTSDENIIIISYPEALAEKVVSKKVLTKNTLKLNRGESVTIDFVTDLLNEYEFQYSEFVVEPGQYCVRGGIIDVFSFSCDNPYRIEFFGNEVDSMRTFNPETQLSIESLEQITIIPNVQDKILHESRESIFEYIPKSTTIWAKDILLSAETIDLKFNKAIEKHEEIENKSELISHLSPSEIYITQKDFITQLTNFTTIELKKTSYFKNIPEINFNTSPQPQFNKNFELLKINLISNTESGYRNYILSDNPKQLDRISQIFNDISGDNKNEFSYTTIPTSIHEGFLDKSSGIACYTDHQIFDRYHRFQLKHAYSKNEALTIKEFTDLKPGDYVTHIDHGVGRFAGLEKIEVGGKMQEAIRLMYKENDLLYISIHSLHKISKYSGKDGVAPQLNRLGSNAWANLKEKTKRKVKEIAFDLIKLYAERKAKEGFQFAPDNYLQNELEASFIYEDTPYQYKSTVDVKKDMESSYPMDRLICGDVGFGKTEIAIRAAFKAVCDSKQVAILVPTTILAVQHYKTFSERLKNLPCKVDYINRFKTAKEVKQTLEELASGKTDIIIGTHRLVSDDIKFKDIGLLIIDEEHKFGVASKEKIRTFKANIDTLTLTATPIPRTLQFSLMGARDLSIINTPPLNRHPVKTEIHTFNHEIIKSAINKEITRGGQVFFIHNRVKNIEDVALLISSICPDVKIAVGHGQLDGPQLEKIMIDFIDGDFDVLVSTTIIESGLDIQNANTIIINDAHIFGLNDLHQMRGRVGRSNTKAYCHLLTPPLSTLSDEARRRLQAIEEFSDLGSGFNIAMRDLDIRGAGNLLGAEQTGFINEIGYETYLKILNEAIEELKETDFKEEFKNEISERKFIKDCTIESDLELLIPDDYISDITERLSLYKELDNIETEEGLEKFSIKIKDRFGQIPKQTNELIDAIRLRWLAKQIGFEKIVMKSGKFVGYFIADQKSEYFQSEHFSKVLNFVKYNIANCKMKEVHNRLILSFENIKKVDNAISVLSKIV